jgi:hypothetical protein
MEVSGGPPNHGIHSVGRSSFRLSREMGQAIWPEKYRQSTGSLAAWWDIAIESPC